MTTAIGNLIRDPERTERFRANAQIAAHELCWEHEEKIIADIVRGFLAESREP